ncbi:hypothetical protein niasHS_008120 [Heterodera schachtii]|uniref:Uncharacterized protein n=1 Tax=Heterodera schachtii TaxID=97005 RepID=A0ABD2J135_HETSC
MKGKVNFVFLSLPSTVSSPPLPSSSSTASFFFSLPFVFISVSVSSSVLSVSPFYRSLYSQTVLLSANLPPIRPCQSLINPQPSVSQSPLYFPQSFVPGEQLPFSVSGVHFPHQQTMTS